MSGIPKTGRLPDDLPGIFALNPAYGDHGAISVDR